MELKLIPNNAEKVKNIAINALKESLLNAKFINNTKPRGANKQTHPMMEVCILPISSCEYNNSPNEGL